MASKVLSRAASFSREGEAGLFFDWRIGADREPPIPFASNGGFYYKASGLLIAEMLFRSDCFHFIILSGKFFNFTYLYK